MSENILLFKKKSKIIWSKKSKINFVIFLICEGIFLGYLLYLRIFENNFIHLLELFIISLLAYISGIAVESIEEYKYTEVIQ